MATKQTTISELFNRKPEKIQDSSLVVIDVDSDLNNDEAECQESLLDKLLDSRSCHVLHPLPRSSPNSSQLLAITDTSLDKFMVSALPDKYESQCLPFGIPVV